MSETLGIHVLARDVVEGERLAREFYANEDVDLVWVGNFTEVACAGDLGGRHLYEAHLVVNFKRKTDGDR